jgi:hypothetical protein
MTPPPTDWKALCVELLQPLAEYDDANPYHDNRDLIIRTRAKLDQSEPEEPTLDCDEIDVPAWHRGDDFYIYKEGYTSGWEAGLKTAADCWGRPDIR